MLHAWCESAAHAALLRTCFLDELDAALKRDTFVLLSICVDSGPGLEELFYADASSANWMRLGGISRATLKSVFLREMKLRPSYDQEFKLPAEALA